MLPASTTSGGRVLLAELPGAEVEDLTHHVCTRLLSLVGIEVPGAAV